VPLDNSKSRNVKRHLISDEASFPQDGRNISQNLLMCSHGNPHEKHLTKFQTNWQLEEDALRNYCKAGTVF